jgi:adenylosuccinate synthase
MAVPDGSYDVVARFNGGANAGHTVIVDGEWELSPPPTLPQKATWEMLPLGRSL